MYGKEDVQQDAQKQAINVSKKLVEFNKQEWVNTKNYDDVVATLGRNRKLIYNKFLNLEQRKVVINFEIARGVMKEILDFSGVKIEEKNWAYLIKFAEKGGIVDFRKLMGIYKDRLSKTSSIPRAKLIYL